MSKAPVDVVLFRTVGLGVVPVEARRFVVADASSVLRRSIFGLSAVEADALLFLLVLPSLTAWVALVCCSSSFWRSRRSAIEGSPVL